MVIAGEYHPLNYLKSISCLCPNIYQRFAFMIYFYFVRSGQMRKWFIVWWWPVGGSSERRWP